MKTVRHYKSERAVQPPCKDSWLTFISGETAISSQKSGKDDVRLASCKQKLRPFYQATCA